MFCSQELLFESSFILLWSLPAYHKNFLFQSSQVQSRRVSHRVGRKNHDMICISTIGLAFKFLAALLSVISSRRWVSPTNRQKFWMFSPNPKKFRQGFCGKTLNESELFDDWLVKLCVIFSRRRVSSMSVFPVPLKKNWGDFLRKTNVIVC